MNPETRRSQGHHGGRVGADEMSRLWVTPSAARLFIEQHALDVANLDI